MGIALLLASLLIAARMGIYQEVLYRQYGKHPKEALCMTHILPLPGFLFLFGNIWEHTVIATNSAPLNLPFGLMFPSTWVYLFANCVTQYLCIGSVYVLTTECSSLTVTLVLTLRKFLSLLVSIVYFQNPFTLLHWVGTTFVFLGTVMYGDLIPELIKTVQTFQRKLRVGDHSRQLLKTTELESI